MDVGATQVFSATGKNAAGSTVLGVSIQFVVVSGNPNASAPLSVAGNGNACAGTWDPAVAICSPGTPGIATGDRGHPAASAARPPPSTSTSMSIAFRSAAAEGPPPPV